MGYEERLRGPVKQDGIPPQRTASRMERPIDAYAHRGHRLTPRLVVLMLTIILLGAGAGVAGTFLLPRTHTARAEILYASTGTQQSDDPLRQDRQLITQLVLLKNRAVLGPVAQKQGRQFNELEKNVDAAILENSAVIQVEVSDVNEQVALRTLQALVDGYLALTSQPTVVVRNLGTLLDQARQNTAALQTRVEQLRTEVLAGTTLQTTLDDARAQLAASSDWEKAIQARINEVGLAGQAGSAAQVLTPPYVLPESTILRWLTAGGIGALIGVIVAGVMLTIGALRTHARSARPVDPSRSR